MSNLFRKLSGGQAAQRVPFSRRQTEQNVRMILNVCPSRKRAEVEDFRGLERKLKRVCFDVNLNERGVCVDLRGAMKVREEVIDRPVQENFSPASVSPQSTSKILTSPLQSAISPSQQQKNTTTQSYQDGDDVITEIVDNSEENNETIESPIEPPAPSLDFIELYHTLVKARDTRALHTVIEQLRPVRTSTAPIPSLKLNKLTLKREDILALCDLLTLITSKVGLRELEYSDCSIVRDGCDEYLFSDVKMVLSAIMTNFEGVNMLKIRWPENRNTKDNWDSLMWFVHMNRNLTQLDISGIPIDESRASLLSLALCNPHTGQIPKPLKVIYPDSTQELEKSKQDKSGKIGEQNKGNGETGNCDSQTTELPFFEMLIVNNCGITDCVLRHFAEALRKRVHVLHFEQNSVTPESIEFISDVVVESNSKIFGLRAGDIDLSGDKIKPVLNALSKLTGDGIQFYVLGLRNANLWKTSGHLLKEFIEMLTTMPTLRSLELDGNNLFTDGSIRDLLLSNLPRMPIMRRLHLRDNGITPKGLVEIAQIIPECLSLAQLDILDNPTIMHIQGKDGDPDASNVDLSGLASLTAAARLSKSLVCVDVEIPEDNEAAITMSRVILGVCIRNMERDQNLYEGNLLEESKRKRAQTDVSLSAISDIYEHDMDGGHGIAMALEIVLADPKTEVKELTKSLIARARLVLQRLQTELPKANNVFTLKRQEFLKEVLESVLDRFDKIYPAVCDGPQRQGTCLNGRSYIWDDTPDLSEHEVEEKDTKEVEEMKREVDAHELATALQSRSLELEEGEIHRVSRLLERNHVFDYSVVPEGILEKVDADGISLNTEQIKRALIKADKNHILDNVNNIDELRLLLKRQLSLSSQEGPDEMKD